MSTTAYHEASLQERLQSRQSALREVDGTSMDDDEKAFPVELRKLAEQAQELATTPARLGA